MGKSFLTCGRGRPSVWALAPLTLLMLGFLPLPASAVPPAPPDPAHPIIGTWRYASADGICFETYHFRRDGTTLITSGAELAESAYEISSQPSAGGYYRLIDRITRDNGQPDCAGAIMTVGHEAINYVRFHPSGDALLLCVTESLDDCFGPLLRIPDQEM